jgi:cytochrome P450
MSTLINGCAQPVRLAESFARLREVRRLQPADTSGRGTGRNDDMTHAARATPENVLDPELMQLERGPPHRLFDSRRAEGGVFWNPPNPAYRPNIPGGDLHKGFWVVTRYDDVLEVSRDQERFSSYEAGIVLWDLRPDEIERQRMNFMCMKPADHVPIRQKLFPPFSPAALKALEPEIARVAREIVDEMMTVSSCEFVFDVAAKLPAYIFCELMGVPEVHRHRVVRLGDALADVETRMQHGADRDPLMELFAICEEVSAQKRAAPDGRMLSAMVNDPAMGGNQMAVNMMFMVFAIAGHETTRSTAAHFIHLMHEHPDQFDLLKGDVDGLLDNAIEEVLRFTSTTTNFRRTATIDTTIGDRPVSKGDKICLSYAAANRDPAVFADPHVFDIRRANARKHIAFGYGPHVCLGANLARMELKALLREIVTRLPSIRVGGEPEWLRSIWFNALVKLPVAYAPTR